MSRIRVVAQECGDRHDEARGAESALQPVALHERLLDETELTLAASETFYGGDVAAVGLDGEEQARSNRFVLQQHGATPAGTMLAPQMRAREPAVVAQEVAQRLARLDVRRARGTVHRHRDRHVSHWPPPPSRWRSPDRPTP